MPSSEGPGTGGVSGPGGRRRLGGGHPRDRRGGPGRRGGGRACCPHGETMAADTALEWGPAFLVHAEQRLIGELRQQTARAAVVGAGLRCARGGQPDALGAVGELVAEPLADGRKYRHVGGAHGVVDALQGAALEGVAIGFLGAGEDDRGCAMMNAPRPAARGAVFGAGGQGPSGGPSAGEGSLAKQLATSCVE